MAASLAMLSLSPQIGAVARLPDNVVMDVGAAMVIPVSSAVRASVDGDGANLAAYQGNRDGLRLTAGSSGEVNLTFRLLGLLPLRTVKVSVQPQRILVPGGQSVGVAMNTRGVVVVGNSDLGRTPSPARLAGIKSGDVIESVDGEAITSAKQLSACLSKGATAKLMLLRGGKSMECDITPARDSRDGTYRLGAWVRDSTAGVGTLTYFDPQSGGFGALGHAITDIDTGVVMPVGAGEIYANRVVDVTRSREGTPGELSGDFFSAPSRLGAVTLNTQYGIFGTGDGPVESALYPEGLPIAGLDRVHEGAATLIATVDDGGPREYGCEIVRVSNAGEPAERSMVIRITDRELLERTGGIVQGMSGSPLIQDGCIIGAVTHVMVNDPTMGYGIGIETMLAASGGAQSRKAA